MYIDLLQIQRSSFLKFLQNGIYQVFDNINPIIIANRKYVFFSKYYLLKIPSPMHFEKEKSQIKTSPKLSTETIKISLDNIGASYNYDISLWKWFNRFEILGLNRLITPKYNKYNHKIKSYGDFSTKSLKKMQDLELKQNFTTTRKLSFKQFVKITNSYPKRFFFQPLLKKKQLYLKNYYGEQRPNNNIFSINKIAPDLKVINHLQVNSFRENKKTFNFQLPSFSNYKKFKSNSFEYYFSMLNRIKRNSLMGIPLIWMDFYKTNQTWSHKMKINSIETLVEETPFGHQISSTSSFRKQFKNQKSLDSLSFFSQDLEYLEKNYANNNSVTEDLLKTSHLTYSSEFYIPVQIIDQISKKMYLRWLLLADLPIQTKRGHFIINGYPKTVIHQIVRSPGIRFKNQTNNLGDNQILADIISMRGAWMGIQIIYEKNLKAENFHEKRAAAPLQPRILRLPKTQTKTMNTIAKNIISNKMTTEDTNFLVTSFPDTPYLNSYFVKMNNNHQRLKNFKQPLQSNSLFAKRELPRIFQTEQKNNIKERNKYNSIAAPIPIYLFNWYGQWIEKKNYDYSNIFWFNNSKKLFLGKSEYDKKAWQPKTNFKKPSKTLFKNYQYATNSLLDNSSQSLKRDDWPELPLNPIKESEKINNALFINFFISPSKNDKGENKKIKLYGLTFLDYLFDNPYFTYNNYVPSSLSSSFFEYSLSKKFLPSYLLNTCNYLPFLNLGSQITDSKISLLDRHQRDHAATMQQLLKKYPQTTVRAKYNQNLQANAYVVNNKYPQVTALKNRESFFPAHKFQLPILSIPSKKNYKSQNKMFSTSSISFLSTLQYLQNCKHNNVRSHFLNREDFEQNNFRQPGKNGKFYAASEGKPEQNNKFSLSFAHPRKTISSNRLLASHISILNTTNFRDILFERFMNAKFYDIGYMGRKRLNKKLRLNIPLQCTTLTPLDFLALFYKLFSLYNHFSTIQNYFPITNPSLVEPLSGFANFSGSLETDNTNRSLGSVALRETKKKLLPIDPVVSPGTEKPSNDLISGTLKQTGSLDHLNQRHIRTSGEFLFLQFWRAILRFYQVLSLLSIRSNFIKSSYTYPGKTGRNFFSQLGIATNSWENYSSNIYRLKRTKLIDNAQVDANTPQIAHNVFQLSSLNEKLPNTFRYRNEYNIPIVDNLNSILKTWGYPNFTSPKSPLSRWNYRFQLQSNGQTFINRYNSPLSSYVSTSRSKRNSSEKKLIQGQSLTDIFAKKETIPTNYSNRLNISTSGSWSRIASTVGTGSTIGIGNQVSGWYPMFGNNSRTETVNIRINRNDIASIFLYSPYNQIPKSEAKHLKSISIPRKQLDQKILTEAYYTKYPLCFTRTITNNIWKRFRIDIIQNKWFGKKIRKNEIFMAISTNFSKRNKSLAWNSVFENNICQFSSKFRLWPENLKQDATVKSVKNIAKNRSLAEETRLGTNLVSSRCFDLSGQIKTSAKFYLMNTNKICDVVYGNKQHQLKKMNLPWKITTLPEFENQKTNLYIKKLLYESKELRVYDAKERMRNLETKLFNGVFKEFFNLDPLSQDLDETNGLSAIIHKRRISALGKGGVTSKNAPLSIRSIHPSFYGRLCPIDSPEGDRVGLINSLTNYARITSIGYIATPFYRTRVYDNKEEYTEMIQYSSSGSKLQVTKSLPMRICPPLAFFGKIYQSRKYTGSVKIQASNLLSNQENLSYIGQQLAFFERISKESKKKDSRRQLYKTWFSQNISSNNRLNRLNTTVDKHNKRKVEVLSFFDTHYMTPPITLRENLISHGYNSRHKAVKPTYENEKKIRQLFAYKNSSFLTGYFDFISFQGYAPLTTFQFFSPGVGLIPFLEHDDGTRALMGANMQRQAVPLIMSSRPIVGTGLEKNVAASFIISSTHSGYLYYISGKQSKQILIRWRNFTKNMRYFSKKNEKIHRSFLKYGKINKTNIQSQPLILNTHWLPYRKSYKATCIEKKPAVLENSWIQKGDLLVNGTSTINGELSLGRNLFSIYMPWEGYNFEDAILISDKAAQDYTSIHVEEFSVKISKNEHVSSIIKPYTWVNHGTALVSKKRKHENSFIMNRLLFGMSSKVSGISDKPSNPNDLFQKQNMNASLLQNKKEQPLPLGNLSGDFNDYNDTSTVWLDSISKKNMPNFIEPKSPSPLYQTSNLQTIQKPYSRFLKNYEILINDSENMEPRIHQLFADHITQNFAFKKQKLSNVNKINFLRENDDSFSRKIVPRNNKRFNNSLTTVNEKKQSKIIKMVLGKPRISLVLNSNENSFPKTFHDLNKRILNSIPYHTHTSVSKLIEKSNSKLAFIKKFRDRNKQNFRGKKNFYSSPATSDDKKNSLLTNKNLPRSHFEIDTSYRTGESISGWVLSVKPNLNHSLSKESLQNPRKISLGNQNNILHNFQPKNSAWFERIFPNFKTVTWNYFSKKAKNRNCPKGILPSSFQYSQYNKDSPLINKEFLLQTLRKKNSSQLNVKLKPWSFSSKKNDDTTNNEKTTKSSSDTIYIYIAVAKPLEVGDKMSGRHGNKGIISKILPFYDMPYLVDGTPIDIILNPLGVPSRMNVGQIYESLLGLTGFYKQEYYRIPPFDENYSNQFSRNFVYWKLNELNQLHQFGPSVQETIESSSFLPKPEWKKNCFSKKTVTFRIFRRFPLYLMPMQYIKQFNYSILLLRYAKTNQSLQNFLGRNQINFQGGGLGQKSRTKAKPGHIFHKFLFLREQSMGLNLYLIFHKQKSPLLNFNFSGKKENITTALFINWNNSLLNSKIPSNCQTKIAENPSGHKLQLISNQNNKSDFFIPLSNKFFSRFRKELNNLYGKKRLFLPGNISFASGNFRYIKNKKNLHSAKQWSMGIKNFNSTPTIHYKMGLNPYFPGKMRLLNGMTGETFYRPIIVGKSYMLKLIHLVHHKIHARATGPYALITQQPLKGKRNQGGQRMGEMEIWALYGFGSASILYEMLTIKSDDPVGRERILREIAGLKSSPGNKIETLKTSSSNNDSVQMLQEYSSFWKNETHGLEITNNDPLEKGIAESFRVLVMNLRALCLDMQVFKDLSRRQPVRFFQS